MNAPMVSVKYWSEAMALIGNGPVTGVERQGLDVGTQVNGAVARALRNDAANTLTGGGFTGPWGMTQGLQWWGRTAAIQVTLEDDALEVECEGASGNPIRVTPWDFPWLGWLCCTDMSEGWTRSEWSNGDLLLSGDSLWVPRPIFEMMKRWTLRTGLDRRLAAPFPWPMMCGAFPGQATFITNGRPGNMCWGSLGDRRGAGMRPLYEWRCTTANVPDALGKSFIMDAKPLMTASAIRKLGSAATQIGALGDKGSSDKMGAIMARTLYEMRGWVLSGNRQYWVNVEDQKQTIPVTPWPVTTPAKEIDLLRWIVASNGKLESSPMGIWGLRFPMNRAGLLRAVATYALWNLRSGVFPLSHSTERNLAKMRARDEIGGFRWPEVWTIPTVYYVPANSLEELWGPDLYTRLAERQEREMTVSEWATKLDELYGNPSPSWQEILNPQPDDGPDWEVLSERMLMADRLVAEAVDQAVIVDGQEDSVGWHYDGRLEGWVPGGTVTPDFVPRPARIIPGYAAPVEVWSGDVWEISGTKDVGVFEKAENGDPDGVQCPECEAELANADGIIRCDCGYGYCENCDTTGACGNCGNTICRGCRVRCGECGDAFCGDCYDEHMVTCSACGRTLCGDLADTCGGCDCRICERCQEVDEEAEHCCPSCHEAYEADREREREEAEDAEERAADIEGQRMLNLEVTAVTRRAVQDALDRGATEV